MISIEEQIQQILLNLVTTIKIHKLIDGNMILDVDYDKAVKEIISLISNNIKDS